MPRENSRKRNRSPEQASGRQRAPVNAVEETGMPCCITSSVRFLLIIGVRILELTIRLQRASIQQLPVERAHQPLPVERDHQQLQFTSDCVRWFIPYVPSISKFRQPKEIKV